MYCCSKAGEGSQRFAREKRICKEMEQGGGRKTSWDGAIAPAIQPVHIRKVKHLYRNEGICRVFRGAGAALQLLALLLSSGVMGWVWGGSWCWGLGWGLGWGLCWGLCWVLLTSLCTSGASSTETSAVLCTDNSDSSVCAHGI